MSEARYTSWGPVSGIGLSARVGFRKDRHGELVPTHIEVRSSIGESVDSLRPIRASDLRDVSVPALMRAARREMANRPGLWPEAHRPRKPPGPASRYNVPTDQLLKGHGAAPRGFKLRAMRVIYASYGCPLPDNDASARRQIKRDLKRARAQFGGGL